MVNVNAGWLNSNAKGQNSGKIKIKIPPGLAKKDGKIDFKGGQPEHAGNPFDRRDLQEAASRTPEQERNLAALKRRLATTGPKTMLAVRVVAADASTTSDEATIRDKWFGAWSFKSQTAACSYDKLVVTPANINNGVENGVVTVTIPNSVSGVADATIRNAVTAQLTADFGSSYKNDIDHVMLCLPPGTSGSWIAYAYINSWLSVYNNQWCNYVSGQMHEVRNIHV